jgi:hypothetical protein
MMRILPLFLLFILFTIVSCEKEKSLEDSDAQQAEGSLQSDATGECLPKTLQGAYIAGVSLNNANFIEVDVDVLSKGPYNISTDTTNGYYFTASGEFSSTGINTIKLVGKGKPLAEGPDIFIVSFDSTYCDIEVTVLPSTASGPASFTLQKTGTDCMDASINGDYTKGIALNSSNNVDIKVNVTTIGSYSISTTATNGMTFAKSGAFAATGVQTVTLTGSGTPVNAGAVAIPVTAGTSNCNFTIDVKATATNPPPPAGTYFWKLNNGTELYQGGIVPGQAKLETTTIQGFTFDAFIFEGSTNSPDTAIVLGIGDISGGIKANETYSSISAGTTNSAAIYFTYGGVDFSADPATAGSNVTVKVISHNTTTKVISGSFSGTLKSAAGESMIITNGQFNVNYQ